MTKRILGKLLVIILATAWLVTVWLIMFTDARKARTKRQDAISECEHRYSNVATHAHADPPKETDIRPNQSGFLQFKIMRYR